MTPLLNAEINSSTSHAEQSSVLSSVYNFDISERINSSLSTFTSTTSSPAIAFDIVLDELVVTNALGKTTNVHVNAPGKTTLTSQTTVIVIRKSTTTVSVPDHVKETPQTTVVTNAPARQQLFLSKQLLSQMLQQDNKCFCQSTNNCCHKCRTTTVSIKTRYNKNNFLTCNPHPIALDNIICGV